MSKREYVDVTGVGNAIGQIYLLLVNANSIQKFHEISNKKQLNFIASTNTYIALYRQVIVIYIPVSLNKKHQLPKPVRPNFAHSKAPHPWMEKWTHPGQSVYSPPSVYLGQLAVSNDVWSTKISHSNEARKTLGIFATQVVWVRQNMCRHCH